MLGIHVDIRGPNSGLGTYSLMQLNFFVIVIVLSTSPDSAGPYADLPRTFGYLYFSCCCAMVGTDANSLPRQLGPVVFDVGIIAATRSIDLITPMMLANPADSKISVASTRVEGMNDFLVAPHTHTYMMKAKIVKQQVLYLPGTRQL